LVEVLLVVEAYVAVRLVLVLLEVMRFVMVPDAEVRSVIVPLVIVVVARLTVPVAVRLPVANDVEEALPNTELPDVILVKTGLGETAIVDVEERTILEPAIKYEAGVVKRLLHWVVEAVSGTE
jgi:hypothetical protein